MSITLKFFAVVLCAYGSILNGKAQENNKLFYDNRTEQVLSSVNLQSYPSHLFGDEIALKFAVFEDTYTYIVPGDPSSPMHKTSVQKPLIFNSVKKINTYLKKQVKKKMIDQQQATTNLNHVLNVALSVFAQPSKALEEELKKAKTPEELLAVFNRVELK